MALNTSNSSNLEQLAEKELIVTRFYKIPLLIPKHTMPLAPIDGGSMTNEWFAWLARFLTDKSPTGMQMSMNGLGYRYASKAVNLC